MNELQSRMSIVHADRGSGTKYTPTAGRTRTTWLLLPLVLLILPPLILYGSFVFGGKTLFWGTPLLQFWPWRRFAAEELHAGRLPLWNPYAGSGVPLLADHQSAVLYPLNVFFWIIPVERAMGLSLALHAIVAGLAMYALLRELGVSRLAGLVAALAFSLSGYMVSRGSFLTEISALPWLPLMWLCARRLFRRKETVKAVPTNPKITSGVTADLANVVLLALIVAVQFLAGHAQTWFYSLCTLLPYALWETFQYLRRTRHSSPNTQVPVQPWVATLIPNLFLLVAVAWGVALAAVQFLPTLELSRLAERTGWAGWERYALQYSMWPWRLITLLLPDFFGNPAQGEYWGYATYWEDAGYIGVLPFIFAMLAMIAWFRHRRRGLHRPSGPGRSPGPGQSPDPGIPANHRPETSLRSAPFFALLALLSLVMALGQNTPVYMLFFRYLPGFGSFQAPARWLGVYTAAMAVLAGLGVDALHASRRLAVFCRLGVAAGVGVAVTAFLGRAYLPGAMVTFADALVQFAVLWSVAMLLLLWGQAVHARKGSRPRYAMWAAAVILVVAADLIYAGYGLNPAIDAALYHPQTQIGAALTADGPQGRTYISEKDREQLLFGQYLDFGEYRPADAEYWWGLREGLHPDLGMVEHLPSANTFEPLVEARYRTLLEAVEDMPRPIALRTLAVMNVAYILDPSMHAKAEVVHRSPSVTVTHNPRFLPRAYVVYETLAANSPEQAMALLASPDFDPTVQVILESPISSHGISAGRNRRPDTKHVTHLPSDTQLEAFNLQPATVLPSPPNQVTIRAVLPQPGYLVLSDTAYPGWQAWADGRSAPILRANAAFRAVPLDAGEHEVIFRYRPLSVLGGAALSGTALLAMVLAWMVVHRSRPTRRRSTAGRASPTDRASVSDGASVLDAQATAREVKGTVLKSIVIIPTYNEAENIRLLVADILSLDIPIDVVVVDDNSPDGTGQIADDLAACYSTVYAIHRPGKLGLGTAYIAGFKYGLAHDYERILTMDADFSHHPSYIPAMLERSRTEADLVIGSRYVRGGGTQGCTLPRKLLSWGANAFAKTVLGLQALDCTAGFRCYRRQVLESIELDAIRSNGYSFLIEMLYRCQRRGWRVSEVPILFENRRRGASKISKQEVLRAMQTVLRLGKERALSRGKRDAMVTGEGEVL